MCNNTFNIKVVEGNEFPLILRLKTLSYVAVPPISEPIDYTRLTDCVLKVGGVEYSTEITEDGVRAIMPATLALGDYNVVFTAKYEGSDIHAAYLRAITIVKWNEQSNAGECLLGSPVVLPAAIVIGGTLTDAELDELKEEFREKNAQLAQAIEDADAAKAEWERKAAELDDVAQQSTLTQGVQDIREDISHIDIDTSTLAKEETAQAARDAALALAPVAQAAEAYNTGKVELAQNITAKGVQAAPTETLPELAEKVAAISQGTIQIDGGEMYAKQLFGSLTTPKYWNLYEVLANLLSDGRLETYGGILLAEYYKGYDSLALSGAGAGGAYVVSDKDSNGQFIMYTEDTTHIWDTEFDGKGNRWGAYCFADEYHDFQITDMNASPRSIFIGRKVGTIKLLANTRTSAIVIPDGNTLIDIDTNGFSMNYGRSIILRNISTHTSSGLVRPNNTEQVYIEADEIINGAILDGTSLEYNKIASIIIKARSVINTSIFNGLYFNQNSELGTFIIDAETIDANFTTYYAPSLDKLKCIAFLNTEELAFRLCETTNNVGHETNGSIYISYKENDKTRTVALLKQGGKNGWARITDVGLKSGWCKPIDISNCEAVAEENLYAHILQRLKQDEPDCGDGVTITLGQTNLDKLTSQESIDLLDLLTNTYGYTFA